MTLQTSCGHAHKSVVIFVQVPPKKKRTPTVVESKKEDVTGADDAPVSVAQPVSVSVPPPGITTTPEAMALPGDGPARRTRTATAVTAEPTTIT